MAGIVLANVVKRFGDFVAVPGLSLEVRDGEFVTLLGPSGCGKTTTLRMVAGLVTPDQGKIVIGDRDVTHVRPEHRRVGMVFQDYALFPHLTVGENISFGLREHGVPAGEQSRRVQEMLGLVQLSEYGDKFPHQLSGGQRQRVALARALAFPPAVLLMDEPLGALDLKLRQTMQLELIRIQRKLRITTLYVTHDQEEALNLSDRIAVMDRGNIAQLGTGPEIYNRPNSPFIADFLGRVNFLRGRVRARDGARTIVEFGSFTFQIAGIDARAGKEIRLGVRPERMRLARIPTSDGFCAIEGQIKSIIFAGNLIRYFVLCAGDALVMVEEQENKDAFAEGQTVWIEWDPKALMAWPDKDEG